MNGYFSSSDSLCNSDSMVSYSPNSPHIDVRIAALNAHNVNSRIAISFFVRIAMRVSRARWFTLLRRVFHYQNVSSRSSLGSNPLNSSICMALEFIALAIQISVITLTLGVSRSERPVWPMRIWIIGYNLGCVLNLVLLYWRYWCMHVYQRDAIDIEQQQASEELGVPNLMNRCRTSLELFFAIWFVMGNVWVFDSRLGSYNRAPKLHALCISVLTWNGLCYSFPFMLFLLLCCCVPLISKLLGYNMNMGSIDRGASDYQISNLLSWRYKGIETFENTNGVNSVTGLVNQIAECCICLAKYRDKEEVRQLPCSHTFHLKCVDQWLKILSSCPLCKQEIERDK